MFIENGLSIFFRSSGVLCATATYRSAGAEECNYVHAINIPLRWSERLSIQTILYYSFLVFVQTFRDPVDQ